MNQSKGMIGGTFTVPFVLSFLFLTAFKPGAFGQIDCHQSVASLHQEPVNIDTIRRISPETYELEYFLEYTYIDEVRHEFSKPDRLTRRSEDSIPGQKIVRKKGRQITYVLEDKCYMIQKIRFLTPLGIE